MKDSLDQELRSKTQNIPVMLPVTSQVAAFSRSYIYVANSKQDLACTVLFKNLSYPNTPTIGECKENANATSIDKVTILGFCICFFFLLKLFLLILCCVLLVWR